MNTVDNHMVTGPDFEEPAAAEIDEDAATEAVRQAEVDDLVAGVRNALREITLAQGPRRSVIEQVAYLEGYNDGRQNVMDILDYKAE